MAIQVAIVYSLIVMTVASDFMAPSVDLYAGLQALWRPDVLHFMQFLWIGILVYMGKSRVAGSIISFYVHSDKILTPKNVNLSPSKGCLELFTSLEKKPKGRLDSIKLLSFKFG